MKNWKIHLTFGTIALLVIVVGLIHLPIWHSEIYYYTYDLCVANATKAERDSNYEFKFTKIFDCNCVASCAEDATKYGYYNYSKYNKCADKCVDL